MDLDRAASLLKSHRERTESELGRLTGARPGAGETEDTGDQAAALVSRDTDEALASLLRRRLEAIERAERRLENGSYGLSVRSGDPIPDARLEIEPWAELTVAEQQRAS